MDTLPGTEGVDPEKMELRAPFLIIHKNSDNEARDFFAYLLAYKGKLSLEDCRTIFNAVQSIFYRAGRAVEGDLANIDALKGLLGYPKKDLPGSSLRAFVTEFGSEEAKADFAAHTPISREANRRRVSQAEATMGTELSDLPREFFARIRAELKKILGMLGVDL